MLVRETDQFGFEMEMSEAEVTDIARRARRQAFEGAVVVVPYASISDADRAQYPEPADQEVHDYWASMPA